MPRSGKLTPKQQAFVDAILAGKSPSEAYRLGYDATKMSSAAVAVEAQRLLKHPGVALILGSVEAEKQAVRDQKTLEALTAAGITRERIVLELARIGFSDMRKVAAWDADGVELKTSEDLDDDTAAAIAEVTETKTEHGGSQKVKLHNKLGALQELGRILDIHGKPPGDDEKRGFSLTINNYGVDKPT